MEDGVLCTLDELTGLVESALAVDYPGAPTGRVRDVPDQRVIRWYITRGLVDRPVASRGRVALYGRRHLLQLVAIKRRQAEGRSLADIQAELAGATDDALATVASLSPATSAAMRPVAAGAAGRMARPAGRGPVAGPAADGRVAAPAPARFRFWADRPEPATAAAAGDAAERAMERAAECADEHSAEPMATAIAEPPATFVTGAAGVVTMRGIRLAPGVTLLIEDGPGAVDPAAVLAAARPLLDLLTAGEQPPRTLPPVSAEE